MIFEICNDGDGIDPQDIPLIFEPGFSTKFNENNGVMASGIGLTHVKHLVEDYFEGTIVVQTKKNNLTCFKIAVPMARMMISKAQTKDN